MAESPQTAVEAIVRKQSCGQASCSCARAVRAGHGLVHCPVHADHTASLNVTLKDNRLLVHCQANCAQDQVVAALRERQLWPEASRPTNGTARSVVVTYDYRDAAGQLAFQTVRYHPKGFSQRRPDGHGGWIYNLKDTQTVLYRLPELLAADPRQTVYVVEGEKDADRLGAEGLVATSSPMGAGKWRTAYAEALRDRRVVVLPDNDLPGQEHAQTVVKSLRGIASSVRIVNLPGLGEHGDVSDFLQQHSIADFRVACSAAPRTHNAADLLHRTLPEPRWAIPGLIAEGLTVLAGRPKFGKSWIALQMAQAVAYGGYALSKIKVDQGEALYLGLEDNERRMQARLEVVTGDGPEPTLLETHWEWPRQDEGGLEALEAWLDEHHRTRLVVVDTWTMFRAQPPKGSDAYFEDTRAARRLKQLADSRHIAIVALHHTRKPFMGGSVSDFLDEVLGSSGLTAVADSILVLQRRRGERNAVLHFTGRDILEESRALEWDDLTCWSIGGSAEEAAATRERQDVLVALRRMDRPTSPSELAAELGKSVPSTKMILLRMSREAQLLNDGHGRYSAPIPVDAEYLAKVKNGVTRVTELPKADVELKNGEITVTPAVTPPAAGVTQAEETGNSGNSGNSNSRARVREDAPHGRSCAGCGDPLGRLEEHWPWLHDGCAVAPVARAGGP